jgi:hypothetical protein
MTSICAELRLTTLTDHSKSRQRTSQSGGFRTFDKPRDPLVVRATDRISVQVRDAERQRESVDQDEGASPGRIKVEPTPRQELRAQVVVNRPRRQSAGRDHRAGIDNGDDASIGWTLPVRQAVWERPLLAQSGRPGFLSRSHDPQVLSLLARGP